MNKMKVMEGLEYENLAGLLCKENEY